MATKEAKSAESAWDAGEDLLAGRLVYEALKPEQRPGWASRLLRLACNEIEPPTPVSAVLEIAADETRWHEAHEAFDFVRRFGLDRDRGGVESNERLDALLDLAEKTAKIIYNASGYPAPFDYNAGWKVGPSLRRVVAAIDDTDFSEAARRAFLFNRSEH